MVKTKVVLGVSHVWVVMEQIRDSKDFKETEFKVKSGPKTAEKVKRVIFKGDGSLDALFSRFLERLNVFWIPHMSGYLMDLIKLIRDDEDFKGALRNVKNGPKMANKVIRVIFKGVVVLKHFFHGYGRDSSCSGLLTCQGNLWNHSETMGTMRTRQQYTKWPIPAKRMIFKEKQKPWCIFLKFMCSSLSLIGFIRFKGTLTCEEYRTH